MPLSARFASLSARALGWASSALVKIYDNFARVTSGSLGTATSGQTWLAINGVWYANSGVAQSASAPSSYPAAGFDVAENATASVVSPSPGAGLMVWETDSGDWWGAATYITLSSTPTYECISNSCCTGSPDAPISCSYFVYTSAVGDACINAGGNLASGSTPCNGTSGTCRFTVFEASASCCGTENTCVSNSCCSTYLAYTTYAWQQFLTILKSIASAVSTVGTSASLGSIPSNQTGTFPGPAVNSLSVSALGNTITASAYSDTGLATLLGTLSEYNASPSGTGVGILLTPSSGYQGTTVGPFSAS